MEETETTGTEFWGSRERNQSEGFREREIESDERGEIEEEREEAGKLAMSVGRRGGGG